LTIINIGIGLGIDLFIGIFYRYSKQDKAGCKLHLCRPAHLRNRDARFVLPAVAGLTIVTNFEYFGLWQNFGLCVEDKVFARLRLKIGSNGGSGGPLILRAGKRLAIKLHFERSFLTGHLQPKIVKEVVTMT